MRKTFLESELENRIEGLRELVPWLKTASIIYFYQCKFNHKTRSCRGRRAEMRLKCATGLNKVATLWFTFSIIKFTSYLSRAARPTLDNGCRHALWPFDLAWKQIMVTIQYFFRHLFWEWFLEGQEMQWTGSLDNQSFILHRQSSSRWGECRK